MNIIKKLFHANTIVYAVLIPVFIFCSEASCSQDVIVEKDSTEINHDDEVVELKIQSKKLRFGSKKGAMLFLKTNLLFGEYRGVETGINIGSYLGVCVFFLGVGYLNYSTENMSISNSHNDGKGIEVHQEILTITPLGAMFPFRLSNKLWFVPSISTKFYTFGTDLSKEISDVEISGGFEIGVNTAYIITKHLGVGLDLRLTIGTPISTSSYGKYPATYASVGLNCMYFF